MGRKNALTESTERSKKILVIEDEPSMLAMVEAHLKASGYDVKCTVDGAKGISITHQWDPDLILLDIMMPAMDGYTVAQRIREFSSTPLIFLTAKGEEDDILAGFAVGADDYIVKPFSAQELLARVRAMLRRVDRDTQNEYFQPVYDHGDLTIDLESARVSLGGEEIYASATELMLLKELAASMGEVLTTERLLASVWGPDYRYDKSVLWVAISRLKQKIEQDPKNPVHILTVKGVGYMMPKWPPDHEDPLNTALN